MLHIGKVSVIPGMEINISGSKSETNRALVLQAQFPAINLRNISNSEDSVAVAKALRSNGAYVDVGHAGTAMRFLTAYFALQTSRTVILSGSARMHERPIGTLVTALRELGADISYLQEDGFPPLEIRGRKLKSGTLQMQANVSSQFVTAVMLIAPSLPEGLTIDLNGGIASAPYIEMSIQLLKAAGFAVVMQQNTIRIAAAPANLPASPIQIESDWSSASYYYAIVAMSEIGTVLRLTTFIENSRQGDRRVADIYKTLGVETIFETGGIVLKRVERNMANCDLDLNDTPDLAQTIAVTCAGLGIPCRLTGLHTLRIKETDRLCALQNELTKLGCKVDTTSDSITLFPSDRLVEGVVIETYDDHRMAMAFAALAVCVPVSIANEDVVVKSYRDFWADLASIGYSWNRV